jgi:DNA-binding response OmpR family regulator
MVGVKKILIIDDEKDFALSIKEIIRSAGFESVITSDKDFSLKLLLDNSFDLILLDMMIPRFSGIDVLKKIRANSELKNQKVAILSVIQLGCEGKNSIKQLKPIEYFQKPITDEFLFKKKLKKLLSL